MGLLSGLLLFPVTGPFYGLKFVLEQIQAQVDAQLLDESQVIANLMSLGQQHEMGEITDDEYASQEALLLEQLNAIRAYKASLVEAEVASVPADDEDAS
ncbi:MAG: gas vesicle protein GvpG [Chloroflexota bacterium]